MNMRRYKRQIGIGLLELMLAIALITVILVLALSYYQVANRSSLVNKAFNDVQTVASAGQSWWDDNDHDFNKLKDINTLIQKGYLSQNFATNPWGGTTTIKGVVQAFLSSTPKR